MILRSSILNHGGFAEGDDVLFAVGVERCFVIAVLTYERAHFFIADEPRQHDVGCAQVI